MIYLHIGVTRATLRIRGVVHVCFSRTLDLCVVRFWCCCLAAPLYCWLVDEWASRHPEDMEQLRTFVNVRPRPQPPAAHFTNPELGHSGRLHSGYSTGAEPRSVSNERHAVSESKWTSTAAYPTQSSLHMGETLSGDKLNDGRAMLERQLAKRQQRQSDVPMERDASRQHQVSQHSQYVVQLRTYAQLAGLEPAALRWYLAYLTAVEQPDDNPHVNAHHQQQLYDQLMQLLAAKAHTAHQGTCRCDAISLGAASLFGEIILSLEAHSVAASSHLLLPSSVTSSSLDSLAGVPTNQPRMIDGDKPAVDPAKFERVKSVWANKAVEHEEAASAALHTESGPATSLSAASLGHMDTLAVRPMLLDVVPRVRRDHLDCAETTLTASVATEPKDVTPTASAVSAEQPSTPQGPHLVRCRVKTGVVRFTCSSCSRVFEGNSSNAHLHMTTHHNVRNVPVLCEDGQVKYRKQRVQRSAEADDSGVSKPVGDSITTNMSSRIVVAQRHNSNNTDASSTDNKAERLDRYPQRIDSDSCTTSPSISATSAVSWGRLSRSLSDSSNYASEANSLKRWLGTIPSPAYPTPTVSGSITSAEGATDAGGIAAATGVESDNAVPKKKRNRPPTVDTSHTPPSPKSYSPSLAWTGVSPADHFTQSPVLRQSSTAGTEFGDGWRDPGLLSHDFSLSLSQGQPLDRAPDVGASTPATTATATSPHLRSSPSLFTPPAQLATPTAITFSHTACPQRPPIAQSNVVLTGGDTSLSPAPHRPRTSTTSVYGSPHRLGSVLRVPNAFLSGDVYPFSSSSDSAANGTSSGSPAGSASVHPLQQLRHSRDMRASLVTSNAQSALNCSASPALRLCGAAAATRNSHSSSCQSAGTTVSTNAVSPSMSPEPAVLCSVCYVASLDALLFPCCHISCCHGCAHLLMDQGRPCPTCASSIQRIVPIRLEQAHD